VLGRLGPVSPAPLDIAVSEDFGTGQPLDPDVKANFETVIKAMASAGVQVSHAQINWPNEIKGHDIQPLQYAGLAQMYVDVCRKTPDLFDPAIAGQIETGLSLSGVQVAAAHQVSHQMRQTLRAALDRYGVIATPTTPCAAWSAELNAPTEIGGRPAQPRDHAAFTPQINHAGVPALSIPCGSDSQGRPLGLQMIAQAGRDGALIALAQQVEPILKEIP
jgi:aspartyl-tRNA(Asn)/glutamyl-tRNA(Gln) amidotransferase subunit A